MSREYRAGDWSPGYFGRDPVVSRSHREVILDHYPGLRYAPFARLFAYLTMTGRWRNGAIPIPAVLLAAMEGKRKAFRHRKYNAGSFLAEFVSAVPIKLDVDDYRYSENQARKITRLCLSTEVSQLLNEEVALPLTSLVEPVYFVSGRAYNRENAKRVEARLLNKILREAANPMFAGQSLLLDYMNSLPSNGFAGLRHNISDARTYANELSPSERLWSLRTLRSFEQRPQPLYRPSISRRTVRLVSDASPLLFMRRHVREILTQGWAWVDLRSAQLAVAARDWNVRPVLDALESDVDIWAELIATICGPGGPQPEIADATDYATFKGIVKPFLYAAIYGMSIRRLAHFGGESKPGHDARDFLLSRGIDPQDAGQRLLRYPLIRSLLSARGTMFRQIIRSGGATDCFGNHYRCANRIQAGSVLASLAQAREFELMQPVFEYAQERVISAGKPAARLTTWLHDGAHIAVRDKKRERGILETLKRRTDRAAHSRGYFTTLEIETSAERRRRYSGSEASEV